MSRGAGPSSGREAVNWDDQVVPALRRRESTIAYMRESVQAACRHFYTYFTSNLRQVKC